MLPEWSRPVLFILGYVILMRWVLPALGIPTCMSGACRIPQAPPKPRAEDAPYQESAKKHA